MNDDILPLKTWRRRRLLTLRALASQAGTSLSTVVALETGTRQARPGTIQSICKALEVKPKQVREFRHVMGFPRDDEETVHDY